MQDMDIATQRYARLDDDVALTWEAVPGVLRYGLVVGLPDQPLPPLDAIMMGEAPGFALVGIPAEFSGAVERGSIGEEERQYGLVAYRRDGSIVVAPDLHFHAAGSAPADRAYFSFQSPLERSTVPPDPIPFDDLAPAALADAAEGEDAAQPATDADPWDVLAAPAPDTAPLNAPPPDVVESLAEPAIDESMAPSDAAENKAPLDVAESIASQDAAEGIALAEVSAEMESPHLAVDAAPFDAPDTMDAALTAKTAEVPDAAVSDEPPAVSLVPEAPGVIDAAGLTAPRPAPFEAASGDEPVAPAAPAAPVEDVVALAAPVEDVVALAAPVEEAVALVAGDAVEPVPCPDPIAVAVPAFWPSSAAPLSAAVATLLDEAALYLLPRWADRAAATRLLERAATLAPDDTRVRALRDQLCEAPDAADDDVEALLREAGGYLERHDYWRAVSLYERVLARQPDHAAAQSAMEQARQVGQWSARMAGANGDAARLRHLGDGFAALAPDLAAASYAASFAALPEVETLRAWLCALVRAGQPGAAEARRGVEALWLSGAVAPNDAQDQALAALDEAERAGAGASALEPAIDALMAALVTGGGDR